MSRPRVQISSVSQAHANKVATREAVGYVSFENADQQLYSDLGFMSGLEIHQQLDTKKKLFCRCPAGLYQKNGEYDAEVIRHMRPTLSEMGEYDGTALMERKTKKNIFYRLKNETACTYDVDDTPPFKINHEALGIALEVALLLKTKIVGELHIARKQYLDGSIPTGFQRTAIIGIEGMIPLAKKDVRIIQLSIEEDSCREVSDRGHDRVYTTDRLGIPLIEMVTYPDMKCPAEVAEAAQYLRYLSRSTGHVRVGIGAGREDVNVSITGSTRIEIKGVARIKWIPMLTHVEAFRQKALLVIRDKLADVVSEPDQWTTTARDISAEEMRSHGVELPMTQTDHSRIAMINLPGFAGILSHFTQPGQVFADELSGRVKVIACLEKPNLMHSEQDTPALPPSLFSIQADQLGASAKDAQVIVWGPSEDVTTAIETIEERCLMAIQGVPNETRKALASGDTIFERVLPGPDRMYPDTDSAPIAIREELIEERRQGLPIDVSHRMKQLTEWDIPVDTHNYILRNNLGAVIERIVNDLEIAPRFVGTLFGHTLKHVKRKFGPSDSFGDEQVYDVLAFLTKRNLHRELAGQMLAIVYQHPNMDMESVLTTVGYKPATMEQLLSFIPVLKKKFQQISRSKDQYAYLSWVMGNLRSQAIGNMPLRDLKRSVEEAVTNG